jgi:hypothetical protein
MDMMNKYLTKDLHEAAYLYIAAKTFSGTSPADREVYFVFEDRQKCLKLQSEYWSSRATVNVREYASVLKLLKDLIFSKKEVFE